MSLRRDAERLIVNALDANVVKVVGGVIFIQGFGSFIPANVADCFKSCPSDATLKVVTHEVTIPDSCECPAAYQLNIICNPDLTEYETNTTFENNRLYEYENPTGGALVALATATGLVEQINNDPYACVTASNVGGTSTTITITSTNTRSDFDVFSPFGTTIVVTPFVRVKLSAYDLKKAFPIKPGQFGADPDLARCGDYCVYHLTIRDCCPTDNPPSDAYDIDTDRQYFAHEREVYFYVDNTLTGFAAYWDTILLANLPCLSSSSS